MESNQRSKIRCSYQICRQSSRKYIWKIDLSIEIGSQVAIVKDYVVDNLGADVILGCHFCDKHVEEIRPWRHTVEVDDGMTFLIIRDALTKTKTKVQIPKAQIHAKQTKRSTDRIFTIKKTPHETEGQSWIKFKTAQGGLVMLEPLLRQYDKNNRLAEAGVYQATHAS